MKQVSIIVFLAFQWSGIGAQVNSKLSDWFYNFPITSKAEVIYKQLIQDSNIRCKNPGEDSNTIFKLGYSFWGTIETNNLGKEFSKVDSSDIELSWGIIAKPVVKQQKKSYSGYYTLLKITYYTNDSSLIDGIFNRAFAELSYRSKSKSETFVGIENEMDYGAGTEIIYLDSQTKLQKVIILKNKFENQKKGVSIEFQINKI